MSKEQKRSIKSKQLNVLLLFLKITDAAGTPTIGGYDSNYVSSVVDNGAGDCTIIFDKPFKLAVQALGFIPITDEVIGRVYAVDVDRISIKTDDATDGTTPKDASFYINVVGCNHRFNY